MAGPLTRIPPSPTADLVDAVRHWVFFDNKMEEHQKTATAQQKLVNDFRAKKSEVEDRIFRLLDAKRCSSNHRRNASACDQTKTIGSVLEFFRIVPSRVLQDKGSTRRNSFDHGICTSKSYDKAYRVFEEDTDRS
jgi:hypothetical protein